MLVLPPLPARPLTPPPSAPTPPPLPPTFCGSSATGAVGREIFINGNGRPHHNHKHDDVISQRGGGRSVPRAGSPPATTKGPAATAAEEDASPDMGRTAVISLHAPPSITTTKVYDCFT